jgi:hypothetical protein
MRSPRNPVRFSGSLSAPPRVALCRAGPNPPMQAGLPRVHHCRPHDVILERREHLGIERLHAIRAHLRTPLPERSAAVELHDSRPCTWACAANPPPHTAQRANAESRYGESCRADAAGCRGTCVAAQQSRQRGGQPSKRLPRAPGSPHRRFIPHLMPWDHCGRCQCFTRWTARRSQRSR